jgi:hypothetical protein
MLPSSITGPWKVSLTAACTGCCEGGWCKGACIDCQQRIAVDSYHGLMLLECIQLLDLVLSLLLTAAFMKWCVCCCSLPSWRASSTRASPPRTRPTPGCACTRRCGWQMLCWACEHRLAMRSCSSMFTVQLAVCLAPAHFVCVIAVAHSSVLCSVYGFCLQQHSAVVQSFILKLLWPYGLLVCSAGCAQPLQRVPAHGQRAC